MDIPYQEINSKTIDRWVEEGWEWGKPVSHEEYEKAKAGTWDVKLTPVKFVPHSWLGELKGKRVLAVLAFSTASAISSASLRLSSRF